MRKPQATIKKRSLILTPDVFEPERPPSNAERYMSYLRKRTLYENNADAARVELYKQSKTEHKTETKTKQKRKVK
jgi:hypothetical protein